MGMFLFGALVGLLVGLGWCYWHQLQAAYKAKGVISSGANLYSAAQDFWSEFQKV